MRPRTVILALALLIVAAILGVVLASHRRPPSGLVNGRLRPCPPSRSCVCSQDEDPAHHVAPLDLWGDPDEAFARLIGRLQERYELLLLDDVYAHFEVTSWLGLESDLELWLNREARVIEVRAASRIGSRDFGANRRRVEALREELRGR